VAAAVGAGVSIDAAAATGGPGVAAGTGVGVAAGLAATGFFAFVTITTKKSFSLMPAEAMESSSFKTFPE
jgi:hypothetical protein